MQNITQKAIELALAQKWNEAISINEEILNNNEKDIEAFNGMAYAYVKTGKIDKAKKTYRKIITLDRYNYIAQKNLEKISSITKSDKRENSTSKKNSLSPTQFLEEPGKTKTLNLINIAPASTLAKIDIGDEVYLYPKKYSIEVRTEAKTYLGALADDISFRLLKFLKAGNEYRICIKNIQKKMVTIFIREVNRGKKYALQHTFMTTSHEWSTSTSKEIKKTLKIEDEDSQEEDVDVEEE